LSARGQDRATIRLGNRLTGRQSRLAGKIKECWYGWPKDISVEYASLVASTREAEGEVYCNAPQYGPMPLTVFGVPAIVLLPTPPFADETATTFFTSFMDLFCGNPRCIRGICGGAPERGSPCEDNDQPLRPAGAT
jgi:hypothetical protein